jgi:hypothetical protein
MKINMNIDAGNDDRGIDYNKELLYTGSEGNKP